MTGATELRGDNCDRDDRMKIHTVRNQATTQESYYRVIHISIHLAKEELHKILQALVGNVLKSIWMVEIQEPVIINRIVGTTFRADTTESRSTRFF